MVIELLLLVLGVVIGYNVRQEKRLHEESLVLEQVDARIRRELAIAQNLNESLRKDVTELKERLSARAASVSDAEPRSGARLDASLQTGP